MILTVLLAALAAEAAQPASRPTEYRCEGEQTVYNDGRDMAAWYAMRRPWAAQLSVDRRRGVWRITEADAGGEARGRGGWGGAMGSQAPSQRPQAQDLPLRSDRRGLSLTSESGEELGRFSPASGRLTFRDWMGRAGVTARCRTVAR